MIVHKIKSYPVLTIGIVLIYKIYDVPKSLPKFRCLYFVTIVKQSFRLYFFNIL